MKRNYFSECRGREFNEKGKSTLSGVWWGGGGLEEGGGRGGGSHVGGSLRMLGLLCEHLCMSPGEDRQRLGWVEVGGGGGVL